MGGENNQIWKIYPISLFMHFCPRCVLLGSRWGDVWGRRGRIAAAGPGSFCPGSEALCGAGKSPQRSRRHAPRLSDAPRLFVVFIYWVSRGFVAGSPPSPAPFGGCLGRGRSGSVPQQSPNLWEEPAPSQRRVGPGGGGRSAGGRDRRENPPGPCTPGMWHPTGSQSRGAVGAPARRLAQGKGVRWMEGWGSACKHSDME